MNLFAGGDGASPLGGALDIIGSLVGGGSPGGSSGTQSTSSKGKSPSISKSNIDIFQTIFDRIRCIAEFQMIYYL